MLSRNAVLLLLAVSQAASPGPAWRQSDAHARLFTPERVPAGTYRVYVSDLGLDDALRSVTADPALSAWPGAWRIESLAPVDALGLTGPYDKSVIARVYGGTPARVARGPRMVAEQPVEAWTLISPYPDDRLRRLVPGTLLIILRLR